MRFFSVFIFVFMVFIQGVFSQVPSTKDYYKELNESIERGDISSVVGLLQDTTGYGIDPDDFQIISDYRVQYYNKWCTYLKEVGLYNDADLFYVKALAACDHITDGKGLERKKSTILNYCDLFLRRGMYESALGILEEGHFTENDHSLYLHYLLREAECYLYQGLYEKSLSLFNLIETFPLDGKIQFEETINKSFLLMEMADAGFDSSCLESAESLFLSALSFDIGDYDKAIVRSNLALVEAKLGKQDEAVLNIEQALSWLIENLGYNHQDVRITLRKKAEIELLFNRTAAALPLFKEYYHKEKEYVLEQFAKMTEQQRLDYWKSRKPLLSEIFALEYEDPGFLYDVALFRRQVAMLGNGDGLSMPQKLSCSKDEVAKNLNKQEVTVEFVKYEKNSAFTYAALLLVGSSKDTVRFIPLWSEEAIKSYDIGGKRLDSALCSVDAEDKNLIYSNDSLSLFVWGKLLPYIKEGSVVYFAPDGILHLLAIEHLPSVNNGKYEIHRLSTSALLAERKKKTRGKKAKTLLIGGMHYNTVPSVQNEGVSPRPNHDAYDYLYQKGIVMYFDYLSGTKDEIDLISEQLKNSKVLEDIDESVLKEMLDDYSIVHLATHGYSWFIDVPAIHYFNRDSITEDRLLLASGIALSGANKLCKLKDRDDGLLSARELCEMELNNVDLVVLSACQSAQGRVSDEGPTGLVRGLKKAGARTIIASLWPVHDVGTMLFMDFFYDEWRDGKGKDGKGCTKTQALHLAQDRLRNYERPPVKVRRFNKAKKKYYDSFVDASFEAPYYWAPFIIIDDI